MKYRIVEFDRQYYIVIGTGYDSNFDPPDYFECVPLKTSFISNVLNPHTVKLLVSEVREVTDKNVLKTLWVLYG